MQRHGRRRRGRAYVGNFGFDMYGGEQRARRSLIAVEPDGRGAVAADDLRFPNGTVITPDGRTLIVGESYGGRLTAFDIATTASSRTGGVWAAAARRRDADGICLDAEGAIWVACPRNRSLCAGRRRRRVLEEVATGRGTFACVLGGPDRRTLFICTAATHEPDEARRRRSGCIERSWSTSPAPASRRRIMRRRDEGSPAFGRGA